VAHLRALKGIDFTTAATGSAALALQGTVKECCPALATLRATIEDACARLRL
jgi:hypothetical protein